MHRNREVHSARPEDANRNLLSVALGGGALYAIAYESGVCKGLAEAGIDVSQAEFIGTSGGVWTASFIAVNKAEAEVEAMPKVEFPNREQGYLQRVGRETFGSTRAANVRATGVRLPSLRHPLPKAEIFEGDAHDLADMVALSSAIPFGYHSVAVNGNNYIDGGARSLVHANRAPNAEFLVVIAALARHFNPTIKGVPVPLGRSLEAMVNREMGQWEEKHNGQASLIRPNREIGGLVEKFSDIFNRKVARKTHDLAIEQGHRIAEERTSLVALTRRMQQPGEQDAS